MFAMEENYSKRANACRICILPRLGLVGILTALTIASTEAISLGSPKAPQLRGLYIQTGVDYRRPGSGFHHYLRSAFAGSMRAGYYPSWTNWAGLVPSLRSGLAVGSYGYRYDEHSSLFFTSLSILPSVNYPLTWGLVPYVGVGATADYYRLSLNSSGRQAHVLQPGWRIQGGLQFFLYQDWGLDLGGFYGVTYGEGSPLPSYGAYGAVFTSYESFKRVAIGRTPYVKLVEKDMPPIFAAHIAHYNEKGLGELVVSNVSHKRLKGLYVKTGGAEESFAVRSSKSRVVPLASSAEARLSLPVSLKRRLWQLTEPMQTTLSLRFVYQAGGEQISQKESLSVKIYPKNFITWDDYRKIGSFITPRDEVISTYARRVLAQWGKDIRRIPTKVGRAMVLLNALAATGLGYSEDPDNGLVPMGREQRPLDYLLLPRQTLQKRAGDCDDLVVLYAALLESVGVETMVAVVPGHVFLLINSGVLPWNYVVVHPERNKTVAHKGSLWLPIEVTSLQKGFVVAWQKGVRQLERYGKAQRQLIHVRSAWQRYSPMDLEQKATVALPDEGRFARLWQRDRQSYMEHTYEKPLAHALSHLKAQPGKAKKVELWNRLALLYAGQRAYAKGLTVINLALSQGDASDYLLAKLWLNKGNFHQALGQKKKALKSYDKALSLDSQCHAALMAKALWYHEQGQWNMADEFFERALAYKKSYAQAYPFLTQQGVVADDSTKARRRLWLALD